MAGELLLGSLLASVALFVVMAGIVVGPILRLVAPAVGNAVMKLLPENYWATVMQLFAMSLAFAITLGVGLVLGIAWQGIAVAALLTGLTSFAGRVDPPVDPFS